MYNRGNYMTIQIQETSHSKVTSASATNTVDHVERPFTDDDRLGNEQQYRAGAYGLLAVLLRATPAQAALEHMKALSVITRDDDEMSLAMSMLGLAAQNAAPESIDDEYHTLFIGLGRGVLVPYASWYLTGFLMEKPLALLREDLASLGFERHPDTREPEDHVAALCEVMAMLIDENRDFATQKAFFTAHIAPWFGQFFNDLGTAKNAVFYRAVGRFGNAFFQLERDYLSMTV
jgi:TorA maturation chaperone TorD